MNLLSFVLIAIVVLIGYGVLRQYLWARSSMKLREIAHVERMMAMEKGVSLENLSPAEGLEAVSPFPRSADVLVWTRIVALCLGLFLLLAGTGICLAFFFAERAGLKEIWTVGLIPIFGGFGLLLFVLLSRDYKADLQHE